MNILSTPGLNQLYIRIERVFDLHLGTRDKLRIKDYVREKNINPRYVGTGCLLPISRLLRSSGYKSQKLESLARETNVNERGLVRDWMNRRKQKV